MFSNIPSKQFDSLLDIPDNVITHIMRLSLATYQRDVRTVSNLIIHTWDEQRIACYAVMKKTLESNPTQNDSAFIASLANNLKIPNNYYIQNNFILSFINHMNFDQKLIIFGDRFEEFEHKYKRYWTVNSGIYNCNCAGIFSGSNIFKSSPLPSKQKLLAIKTEKNLHDHIVEIKKYSEEINEDEMTDLCNIYINNISARLDEKCETEEPQNDRVKSNHHL